MSRRQVSSDVDLSDLQANRVETVIDTLFTALVETRELHGPTTGFSRAMKGLLKPYFRSSEFARTESRAIPFGPFGEIVFPYRSMGAVDTVDLFGFDELVLFSFYLANRRRYRRVVDIGANLGLHSIVLSRCEFEVFAYEPDPLHYGLLTSNLAANKTVNVRPIQAAVSDHDEPTEFVRVKGNTTGSHLAGSKAHPYGDLDRFMVRTARMADVMRGCDFVKIDAEGHEATMLCSTTPEAWESVDAVAEVGSLENAERIFRHFAGSGINLFSQKAGWGRVTSVNDVPAHHTEGSLFISAKARMPWSE